MTSAAPSETAATSRSPRARLPSRRFLRRGALALAVAAALASLAALPLLGGGEEIPTYRVEEVDFVRRVTADGHLAAERTTPLSVSSSVRQPLRIAWTVPDGSRVEAGDPVVRFDATEAERGLVEAREDLARSDLQLESNRVGLEAEISNLGRDVEMAEREVENASRFQKKDELVFSRQEILESAIDGDLARERKRHRRAAQENRREMGAAERELLAIEKRRARQKIEEAEAMLDSLELVAPHAGIVVFARDWRGNMPRVGDTTFPGRVLAEIPDSEGLEAEVYVLEADAGGLAAGRAAEVVPVAHPEVRLPAEIARVDNLAKPRFRGSPVQYFAVTLRLDGVTPELRRLLKPGSRVTASLVLAEEEDALVVPRQAVFEREGESVVYRRGAGGFEPVAVELGASGLGRVVVTSGLEAGDVVALVDPERGSASGEDDPEPGSSGPGGPMGALGGGAGP